MRQGNPATIDVVFGTILIVVLLEAVRRTLGIIVPIIIGMFIVYAVFVISRFGGDAFTFFGIKLSIATFANARDNHLGQPPSTKSH